MKQPPVTEALRRSSSPSLRTGIPSLTASSDRHQPAKADTMRWTRNQDGHDRSESLAPWPTSDTLPPLGRPAPWPSLGPAPDPPADPAAPPPPSQGASADAGSAWDPPAVSGLADAAPAEPPPALPPGPVTRRQIAQRGWPSVEAFSSYGVDGAHLEAAEAAGVDLDAYYLARRTGASHDQTMEVAATPATIGNLLSYVMARWSGGSHAEIAEAAAKGMSHVDYGLARARGGTHADAVDAFELGVSAAEFESLQRAGIDRDEIRSARAAGVELRHYAAARMVGASAADLGEVLAQQISLTDYTLARHGASHAEILTAYRSGADLFRYSSGRHSGLDHETALSRALAAATSRADSPAVAW